MGDQRADRQHPGGDPGLQARLVRRRHRPQARDRGAVCGGVRRPSGWSCRRGPDGEAGRFDIFQNYEVRTDRRDELRAHLLSRGVGTIAQWGGVALHQFRGLGFDQHLPLADRWAARSLLLPMNHLLNDGQVERVIGAVEDFFA